MNLAVLLTPEYLELKSKYDLLHSKYTNLVEETSRRHEQLVKENEALRLENKQILAMVQEIKEVLDLKISENKILKKESMVVVQKK